jgi:hypothetical protein
MGCFQKNWKIQDLFYDNVKFLSQPNEQSIIIIDVMYFWMKKFTYNTKYSIDDPMIYDKFAYFILNILLARFNLNLSVIHIIIDNPYVRKTLNFDALYKKKIYENNCIKFCFENFQHSFKLACHSKFNIIVKESYLEIINLINIKKTSTLIKCCYCRDRNYYYYETSKIVLFSGNIDYLANFPLIENVLIVNDVVGQDIFVFNLLKTLSNELILDECDLFLKNIDLVARKKLNTNLYIKLIASNSIIYKSLLVHEIFNEKLKSFYITSFVDNTLNLENLEPNIYFYFLEKFFLSCFFTKHDSVKLLETRTLIENSLAWLSLSENGLIIFDFTYKFHVTHNEIDCVNKLYNLLNQLYMYFFDNLKHVNDVSHLDHIDNIKYVYINHVMNLFFANKDSQQNKAELCLLFYKISLIFILVSFFRYFPMANLKNIILSNIYFEKFKKRLFLIFYKMSECNKILIEHDIRMDLELLLNMLEKK